MLHQPFVDVTGAAASCKIMGSSRKRQTQAVLGHSFQCSAVPWCTGRLACTLLSSIGSSTQTWHPRLAYFLAGSLASQILVWNGHQTAGWTSHTAASPVCVKALGIGRIFCRGTPSLQSLTCPFSASAVRWQAAYLKQPVPMRSIFRGLWAFTTWSSVISFDEASKHGGGKQETA